MARAGVRFKIGSIKVLDVNKSAIAEATSPWLFQVGAAAVRIAKTLVNVDTGNLRATIDNTVVEDGENTQGFVFATASYALWQETEPGDPLPQGGRRIRSGGKPYLRPAVQQALRQARSVK